MRKALSALLAVFICSLAAFVMTACGTKEPAVPEVPEEPEVTVVAGSITLSQNSALIEKSHSVVLTATFTPDDPDADVSDVTITWSSDNTAVASVMSDGTVIANAKGKAKITAEYGNAKKTCAVEVYDLAALEAATVEFSDITISVNQSKLSLNLKKSLGRHYTSGEPVLAVSEGNQPISYTQNGDNITFDFDGAVGLHTWVFTTAHKKITAEVCNATHIIGKIADFAALSAEWDEATKGNSTNSAVIQNTTKNWYIAMNDDIDFAMGVDYRDTYTFGNEYATDGNFAVFNGTFDGRGHIIKGLRSRAGFISNLGKTGVIKNLAIIGSRNGEGKPYTECQGGILGARGHGLVENVFIEGWLYWEDGHASGMYNRTTTQNPLTVKNSLVMIEIKEGNADWAPTREYGYPTPGFFSVREGGAVSLTNSFGISSYFTRVDAATESNPNITFKSYEAFLNSGSFNRLKGSWDFSSTEIIFFGRQVYTTQEA